MRKQIWRRGIRGPVQSIAREVEVLECGRERGDRAVYAAPEVQVREMLREAIAV